MESIELPCPSIDNGPVEDSGSILSTLLKLKGHVNTFRQARQRKNGSGLEVSPSTLLAFHPSRSKSCKTFTDIEASLRRTNSSLDKILDKLNQLPLNPE